MCGTCEESILRCVLCAECKMFHKAENKHFCSQRCAESSIPPPRGPMKHCERCGKTKERSERFCSFFCANISAVERSVLKHETKADYYCWYCFRKKDNSEETYCSKECRIEKAFFYHTVIARASKESFDMSLYT